MNDWLPTAAFFGVVALLVGARVVRHFQIGSMLPALLSESGWTHIENTALLGYRLRGSWNGTSIEAEYRFPGRNNPGALVLCVPERTSGMAAIRLVGPQPLAQVITDAIAALPVVHTVVPEIVLRGAPEAFATAVVTSIPRDMLIAVLERPYDELFVRSNAVTLRKEIRRRDQNLPQSLRLPREELRSAVSLSHRLMSELRPVLQRESRMAGTA